jgi:competence protein ComEC
MENFRITVPLTFLRFAIRLHMVKINSRPFIAHSPRYLSRAASRTGTAHLIAISGSHISLIAGFCFVCMRWLCAAMGLMRYSPARVAVVVSLFAAVFYSALADFAIPTRRALVMIVLAMGAVFLQRNTRPLHVLMLALLLVTLHDPAAILSAGFWLSFAAIGIILYVAADQLGKAGWWTALWKINWATSLGLAPLTLLFFQQVSLVSPLANLLAIPVLGVLAIPLCLISALLLPIVPAAGDFLLHAIEILLHGFWPLLQWMASWDWVQWTHSAPPGWTLLFALPGVLLLLAPRATPARWLGLILWLPALTQAPAHPPLDAFRLTLLDVGQGLSAIVQTQAHTLVFDTGARVDSGFDMGSAVVEPFLRDSGVDTVDTLVISHGDNDHIGGAYSLRERMNIRRTLTSVPERLSEFSPEYCQAGQSWEWDGVHFDILSPDGDLTAVRKENDNSCVLRVARGNACALLTADIEKEAENRLVGRYGADLHCNVLVVPHHGSNTSSTSAFLAAVQPEYALIPAGFLNRFNFPRPEVIQRYRAQGTLVLNTAEEGAIRVEFSPDERLAIDRYRLSHARYWNARHPLLEGFVK